MNIFKRILTFYWENLVPAEKYARHIGVTIGKGCRIASRNWSSEPYLISIGDNVQVTRNVSFYTHGGCNAIRNRIPDFDTFGKIKVEDQVYLGAFSQIMPGVTIGEGAIVAAGAIVTKSVEPYTVVGGNPARYICTIEEFIAKNKKYNVHTYGKSKEEKKQILLSLSDDKFIVKEMENVAYLADKQRNRGGVLRFLRVFRTFQCSNNKIVKLVCKVILKHYREKYGLEIPPETKIGKGLYLGHAFNITINGHSVIGNNFNIHKGVVIGRVNRGARKGCPTLGDKVWAGINSAIVGKVIIGDDVLIAPNSYVNVDVPSHSVVFGNPCVIKHRDNATEGYINNIVD